jgi:pterin-4a-carbinolamine dehydratase
MKPSHSLTSLAMRAHQDDKYDLVSVEQRVSALNVISPIWTTHSAAAFDNGCREVLRCVIEHSGMNRCVAAVASACAIADEIDHHPEIVLGYRTLTLTVSTHTTSELTWLDFAFAARFSLWLTEHPLQ